MNTLLSIIGAILVFVLGTLFAVPHFVDWNQYRGIIEEEASRAVGRDVRIGANVHVRLLPTPSIRLEDVRIADTAALTGDPIFRTAEVSAKLAISPLLRGAVEVSEIELVQPVVRLVVDDGGVGNWQSLAGSAPGLSYLPSNISLNTVIVSNGKLVLYSDGGRRERLVLDAIAGDVSTPGPSSPHRFKGRVSLGGSSYDVRGQLTEADGQGSRRVSMTARSDAGGTTRFEGRTETIAGLPAVKGEVVANIPFSPEGTGRGVQSVEIKTELAADTRTADLTSIQVGFESGDRPQSLSGTGRIRWQGETDLTISIGAQWLDIDALSG
ncbi:MAG TPA: AsmA family protein, partial [Hyphomicrobiaceae bacterium]|nr:AsmA family protein [Hyphomicrobiaceae bacterium]